MAWAFFLLPLAAATAKSPEERALPITRSGEAPAAAAVTRATTTRAMTTFREQATAASKMAFDLLATGPRQRSDRIQRRFKDAREGDINEAVLAAIAATGPRTQLPYDELRASLRNVLDEEPPQRHEVTRVLDALTEIAKIKIEGEPVVEFDESLDMIYISDPFFAFFLRWGTPAGVGDPVRD